eukprot:GHVL01003526.1.p1 GENE.GHVL01003526.1~~GHVL01003526.1.p1  ORF type:complete len:116 (-),score=12.00 GHVL01003526.1:12-359(-)
MLLTPLKPISRRAGEDNSISGIHASFVALILGQKVVGVTPAAAIDEILTHLCVCVVEPSRKVRQTQASQFGHGAVCLAMCGTQQNHDNQSRNEESAHVYCTNATSAVTKVPPTLR